MKAEVKDFSAEDLKKEINSTLQSKTSDIMDLMTCSDEENTRPLITMTIARACYLAYTEGDTKKLQWLLDKMGIGELPMSTSNETDFSSLDNATILKALNGGK